MLRISPAVSLLALGLLHSPTVQAPTHRTAPLRLVQFASDSSAYNVGSTLIVGPTEALLVDAEYHRSDAERVAREIAAMKTHLEAIFVTHSDEDHYFGATALVERFPGTPVYMTAAAIEDLKRMEPRYLQMLKGAKEHGYKEAPDSLVTPQVLPSTSLTVDGQRVEVVPDQQGDVLKPSNSFVWIPSLRAVIAGDIIFNHVHPWLAASDVESRQRWHRSIARIAAFHPQTVIAMHKKTPQTPDTPDVLRAMDQYLTDFDAARVASPDSAGLVTTMKEKYPDWAIPVLLEYSARAPYKKTGA